MPEMMLIAGTAGIKVILAETGCNMNNAGAVFGRDKLTGENLKAALLFQMSEIREHRLIAHADQIPAFKAANFYGLLQLFFVTAKQRACQNILLAGLFHYHIINILADSQHQV